MSPTAMPTAARATPIMLNLPVADAPDLEEEEPAEEVDAAADAVSEAVAAEPVAVPEALGVADAGGYAEPRALISNGCDWA